MSALPSGWALSTVGDVCLPITKTDPAATGREQVAYVDIGSVNGDHHALGAVATITAKDAPSRCRQLLRAGDTVFSTVRPYLEKIAYVDASLDGEFASTGFCVLRPGPRVLPRFLFYYSISRAMLEQVLVFQRGVSYPAVLDKDVRATLIPVPPLDEQRRIVDILEDHLSRLDAAVGEIRRSRQRLAGLQEQVITSSITGKGQPGDRALPGLPDVGTDDGVLTSLPIGWTWRRLADLAAVVGGVTKDASRQSDPEVAEVPYLRVANVQRGRLDLREVTKIRVAPEKVAALLLVPGDVLMNEGGDRDKLARGWVWEGQIAECIHQNHVFRARVFDNGIEPRLLSWSANTLGARWAARNGKQSVNLASISLSRIRQMPVPVPPTSIQGSLVAELTGRLSSIQQLDEDLGKALARAQNLRRALYAAAFTGRLTRSSPILEDL